MIRLLREARAGVKLARHARRLMSAAKSGPGQRVACLKADSQSPETARRVSRWFGRQPLDFLFIKTRYGKETGAYAGEVHRLWQEIKRREPETREFVEDPSQDGYGIGVVIKR